MLSLSKHEERAERPPILILRQAQDEEIGCLRVAELFQFQIRRALLRADQKLGMGGAGLAVGDHAFRKGQDPHLALPEISLTEYTGADPGTPTGSTWRPSG